MKSKHRMSGAPLTMDADGADSRPSVPGVGRSLVRAAEDRSKHFRLAVSVIENCLRRGEAEANYRSICAPRWSMSNMPPPESISSRASRFLANIWLAAYSCGGMPLNESFQEAEKWFLGDDAYSLEKLSAFIDNDSSIKAISHLEAIADDQYLRDLLPYILDPHGPASRLDVIRDPLNLPARNAKKECGVFYTPSDVADFMVEHALQLVGTFEKIRWLDPSCGTGVFLVSVLRAYARLNGGNKFDFAIEHLYGIDQSCQAIESCAFVMLHHCIVDAGYLAVSPWRVWQALRLNLASADTLKIRPVNGSQESTHLQNASARQRIRKELLNFASKPQPAQQVAPKSSFNSHLPFVEFEECGMQDLGEVFPEVAGGFEIIIGNPPYAPIGDREDATSIASSYKSCSGTNFSASANGYTLFVEMMWRLTRENRNVSALVVPLSIAYHQGRQYSNCRNAMSLNGGRWQFAFFDREPHALFGEEAKTRNAILFRMEAPEHPARGNVAQIETGALRKWTSRMRARLFRTIEFTPIGPVELANGLPKLEGKLQGKIYSNLKRRTAVFGSLWSNSGTCLPCVASNFSNGNRIYVATTAYNFINVFRGFRVTESQRKVLSENRVHFFEFENSAESRLAFAILSSRLTYWLWHAECDGFHVGRSFIDSLPYDRSSFNTKQAAKLSALGEELWHALQRFRIESKNKGKLTIAFRPLACDHIRERIDEILLESAGLPIECNEELKKFVFRTVVVDHTDERRMHLTSIFDGTNQEENQP